MEAYKDDPEDTTPRIATNSQLGQRDDRLIEFIFDQKEIDESQLLEIINCLNHAVSSAYQLTSHHQAKLIEFCASTSNILIQFQIIGLLMKNNSQEEANIFCLNWIFKQVQDSSVFLVSGLELLLQNNRMHKQLVRPILYQLVDMQTINLIIIEHDRLNNLNDLKIQTVLFNFLGKFHSKFECCSQIVDNAITSLITGSDDHDIISLLLSASKIHCRSFISFLRRVSTARFSNAVASNLINFVSAGLKQVTEEEQQLFFGTLPLTSLFKPVMLSLYLGNSHNHFTYLLLEQKISIVIFGHFFATNGGKQRFEIMSVFFDALWRHRYELEELHFDLIFQDEVLEQLVEFAFESIELRHGAVILELCEIASNLEIIPPWHILMEFRENNLPNAIYFRTIESMMKEGNPPLYFSMTQIQSERPCQFINAYDKPYVLQYIFLFFSGDVWLVSLAELAIYRTFWSEQSMEKFPSDQELFDNMTDYSKAILLYSVVQEADS